jgi:HSP20 family molecular chaperone IbpA
LHTIGEKSLATRDETRYVAPPVDIFETEGAIVVIADLPGVDKEDVDIRVDDGILTIKGKADYCPPASILRLEFSLEGYFRQFQLSDEVDQEKISAESKNGVLTINLPKAEKSKPKQIKVKLG